MRADAEVKCGENQKDGEEFAQNMKVILTPKSPVKATDFVLNLPIMITEQ
jgi:hypothetical protein